jgi:hypothetical protein
MKGTVYCTGPGGAHIMPDYMNSEGADVFLYPDPDGVFQKGDEVEIVVTKSVPVTADDLDKKLDNKMGGIKE